MLDIKLINKEISKLKLSGSNKVRLVLGMNLISGEGCKIVNMMIEFELKEKEGFHMSFLKSNKLASFVTKDYRFHNGMRDSNSFIVESLD